jgi:biotin transport system ATP-binding protein
MTVTFENASVSIDGTRILEPVTLELSESRISVIGANGSGKSTLIRMINALTPATTGNVAVNGVKVGRRGRKVRGTVGFLFSDPDNQIIMPTVGEDIAFSLRGSGLSRDEINDRVNNSLESFGLTGKNNQSPHVLSGGEKQMLALASITALTPEVIVADEPSCLLDLANRNTLRRTFARLSQQLIVVTHDLKLAADAERTLCVDSGRIIDDGNPGDVISRYIERMDEVSPR